LFYWGFLIFSARAIEELFNQLKAEVTESIESWHEKLAEDLKNDTLFCLSFVLDSIVGWEAISRKGWRG